jgi:hypothetical protein
MRNRTVMTGIELRTVYVVRGRHAAIHVRARARTALFQGGCTYVRSASKRVCVHVRRPLHRSFVGEASWSCFCCRVHGFSNSDQRRDNSTAPDSYPRRLPKSLPSFLVSSLARLYIHAARLPYCPIELNPIAPPITLPKNPRLNY